MQSTATHDSLQLRGCKMRLVYVALAVWAVGAGVGCPGTGGVISPPPKWAVQPPFTLEDWTSQTLGLTRDEIVARYGRPTRADVSRADVQTYTYATTVPLWRDSRTGQTGNSVRVMFIDGKVREISGGR